MSNTIAIAVLSVDILESLLVFTGNIFTVFVFWIHRNELKRTSFLLINLAITDLLVGLLEIVIGTLLLPRHSGPFKVNPQASLENISIPLESALSSVSMFFLVLISLERAFALIWPLRHRVASSKTYIYSVIIVWFAGITLGVFSSLAVYRIFKISHYMVLYSVIIILSLVTICVSYLAIRTRLNHRVPAAIATAHNRQSVERNTKLSKTLFIMIGASIFFWVPSLVYFCVYYFVSGFPVFLTYIFSMLTLANSLVNPIIYSLRMPMFRETLKRLTNKLRIRKQSENYAVDCGAFKMRTAKETVIVTYVSPVNN